MAGKKSGGFRQNFSGNPANRGAEHPIPTQKTQSNLPKRDRFAPEGVVSFVVGQESSRRTSTGIGFLVFEGFMKNLPLLHSQAPVIGKHSPFATARRLLPLALSMGLVAHAAPPATGALAVKAGPCQIAKAEKAIAKGDHEAALKALGGCAAEPRAEKARGIAWHGRYKPDSAIAHLKQAMEQGLKEDAVLLPLAEALLWKKDFRSAAQVMEGVKDRESAAYHKVVARKHEILGDLQLAVDNYDKAIALEKLPYGTMERKAIVLSWMKQFDASIALFDAIVKEKVVSGPLKVRCMVRKAEVISWKGDLDGAIAQADKAIALDKKDVEARLVKGRTLEWKGDYKSAKAVYKEILDMAPGHEQAKLKLEKLSWVE